MRHFGADIDIKEYFEIVWRRARELTSKIQIPKAMELEFEQAGDGEALRIRGEVEVYKTADEAAAYTGR